MATPIVNSTSVTAPPPSRPQEMRTFLQPHNLRAWITWREDNVLVTESGLEVLSRIERNVNGTDDQGNRS